MQRTKKTLTVTFLHSPTGKFGLAYSKGDTVELPENLALEIVDAKYGELVVKLVETSKSKKSTKSTD